MSKTSKSPKTVLIRAFEVGQGAFADYSHKHSPQTFTQPQLFACLVLKAFFQMDYRSIQQVFEEWPELGAAIGMKKVPHFTTLQKAEQRLLNKDKTRKLLQETIRKALTNRQMKRIIELAAIDGTGFESRHISDHFLKRLNWTGRELWFQKYPKIGLLCDCSSHMTLAVMPGRGPSSDYLHFKEVLGEAIHNVCEAVSGLPCRIKNLVADAAYDSETHHEFARRSCDIQSHIPATKGRPSPNLPQGRWRRRMTTHFNYEKYAQRWQVETVFSMIKRRLGSSLTARSYHSQCRELRLRVLTLNIMILATIYFLLFIR